MSPFRRKATENALVAVLRNQRDVEWTVKAARPFVADQLGDACSAAELAGAVQSLRYQGKLEWDRLALSASMIEQNASAAGNSAAAEAEGGADSAMSGAPSAPPSLEVREEQPAAGDHEPPAADPEDEEDYPGGVNDVAGRPTDNAAARSATSAQPPLSTPPLSKFGANLHIAGIHAANTRAAAKPPPAPAHEPEIARLVREEATASVQRRGRARSTATVSQPLELRKFGVDELSFAEGVASLLVEDPNDLMAAINRKHSELWRRVLLLARRTGERPAAMLYAALERGLESLEYAASGAGKLEAGTNHEGERDAA